MRRRWLGRPVGSSPHTRGTRYCTNNECETFRFIPAYAGNEQTVRVARLTWPVHPRIRGERALRGVLHRGESGSSPHTRGTHRRADRIAQHHRFIPAYAGNAVSARMPFSMPTVHPRIRGERRIPMRNAGHLFGSSPHTRGTQQRDCPCRALDRFIPAYAGNARRTPSLRRRATVHPRIRGERGNRARSLCSDCGSSPHTRGTRGQPLRGQEAGRFIPAYAGNAALWGAESPLQAVHPRIRGERSRSS